MREIMADVGAGNYWGPAVCWNRGNRRPLRFPADVVRSVPDPAGMSPENQGFGIDGAFEAGQSLENSIPSGRCSR